MQYKNITITNLTAHDVNVFTNDGQELTIHPSGIVARRGYEQQLLGDFEGINVSMRCYDKIVYYSGNKPLPGYDIDPTSIYIVSRICLAGRDTPINFFAPGDNYTANGNRIGGEGLIRVKYLDLL